MMSRLFVKTIFLYLIIFNSYHSAFAQCNNPINSFPYNEGFELNNGNWLASTTIHWQWGTIVSGTKSIISAAATGSKCWIVGGLSGANYAGGNSYLTSPCFNFSLLTNPEISFNVLWETENGYDGVNFQYSTDLGASWNVIGSTSSNNSCSGEFWYNSNSIRFLGNKPAWSGSTLPGAAGGCASGNGIGHWVKAKHNLTMLAGRNNVLFRFEFGAGTRCNEYEGFAIDDINIQQAPTATGSPFTYNCLPNRTVAFTNNAPICQATFSWNFDDLSSGSNNTSTATDPSHTFSAPGIYNVRQAVTYPSGTPVVYNQQVVILGVTTSILNPISCNGASDGSIQAIGNGGNNNYSYTWNTVPSQQTAILSNLSTNTYSVTITAPNSCEASSSIALVNPTKITVQSTPIASTCNLSNGSINTIANGGASAYVYQWSNGQSSQNLTNLSAGSYHLQITDANGCNANDSNIIVANNTVPVSVFLGDDQKICTGKTLLLQPGSYAGYLWQDNSTASNYQVSNSGTYSVQVTNTEGCKAIDEINIVVDECKGVFFPTAFTPNNDRINDYFGPIGDLASLKDFSLFIFNRWGQMVFESHNPYQKWNGKYKGKLVTMEVLVWKSTYKLYSASVTEKKGTIIAIQ
jgi:gliding motility-associated-like protein